VGDHHVNRVAVLFGQPTAQALAHMTAPRTSGTERDLIASYLFEPPAVLADPSRPKSRGQDGYGRARGARRRRGRGRRGLGRTAGVPPPVRGRRAVVRPPEAGRAQGRTSGPLHPRSDRPYRCRGRTARGARLQDRQSIYRFRRADIGFYDRVRSIVARRDYLSVTLSANFTSTHAAAHAGTVLGHVRCLHRHRQHETMPGRALERSAPR
jgi:hypothetical protein